MGTESADANRLHPHSHHGEAGPHTGGVADAGEVLAKSGENADSLPLLLPKEKLARLETHAAALGCVSEKLAAVLLELMAGLETAGAGDGTKAPPRRTVNPVHSRTLRRLAAMLEVEPGDLLGWELDDVLRDMTDPRSGMLKAWAAEQIRYEDPKTAARVKRRVRAWIARRAKRTPASA